MKILTFSDWRTQPNNILSDLISATNPDVILYAGDDLNRFIKKPDVMYLKSETNLIEFSYPDFEIISSRNYNSTFNTHGKEAIDRILAKLFNETIKLDTSSVPFYYINGNDDLVSIFNGKLYLKVDDCYSLHETSTGKISSKCPTTIFSKTEFELFVEINPSLGLFNVSHANETISIFGVQCEYGLTDKVKNPPESYADIYLTHIPPLGILDISSRFCENASHIGSSVIRESIINFKPKLVICGHSHAWGGYVQNIGDTTIINVSSHDDQNPTTNYAIINTENWSIDISNRKPQKKYICGLNTAIKFINNNDKFKPIIREEVNNGNVSNIGIVYAVLKTLNGNDLAKFAPLIKRIETLDSQLPVRIKKLTFNPHCQTFIDIETGLSSREDIQIWLVGILHNNNVYQFQFPENSTEFFQFLDDNEINSVASWTKYDIFALKPYFLYSKKKMIFIDACHRVRNSIMWHNYSLHDLHNVLFPSDVSEPDISGYHAGIYAEHLIIPDRCCPYCPDKETIKQKIIHRNKLDLIDMKKVCCKIYDDYQQ